jgi:hypothetical protein
MKHPSATPDVAIHKDGQMTSEPQPRRTTAIALKIWIRACTVKPAGRMPPARSAELQFQLHTADEALGNSIRNFGVRELNGLAWPIR